jgi:hypothetical protein
MIRRAPWVVALLASAVLFAAPCLAGVPAAATPTASPATPTAAVKPAGETAEKTPQPLPPRIEFALSDVRYQALPNEVRSVRVGPDDRVWLDMHSPSRPYDSDWCRRQIEQEFSQKSPQLTNIVPVLFEPGGRIWFKCNWDWALLAYDGKTFIEKANPVEEGFFRSDGVWAGGCALFASDYGVFCYDGKAWSFQRLYPQDFFKTHPTVAGQMLHMLPQPDGDTVLVLARGYGLWRWRKGQPAAAGAAAVPGWTEIKLPPDSGGFRTAAPWGDGLLIIPEKGPTYLWRDETAPPADVADLVKRLGAADFKDREAATQEFMAMGARGLGAARQAIQSATDPEIQERLKKIIAQLELPKVEGVESFSVGQYRFEYPAFPERSDLGATLIWSRRIIDSGRTLGPGLALILPGNEVRTLLGGSDQVENSQPVGNLAVMPDKSVWCSFNTSNDMPAHRIDLKEGKFVDDTAGLAFGMPMAGRRDGMTFFRVRYSSAIVAYKESAPENRRFVDATAFPMVPMNYDPLAPDGTLWMVSPEARNVIRVYDGKNWKELPQPDVAACLMPGRGGATVVMGSRNEATLLADGKSVKEQDLETLIERHPKEFAAAFAAGDRGSYTFGPKNLVADKAGNVWVLNQTSPRSLKVLAGGKWLDASAALTQAGLNATFFPNYISAVGDSSKVIACESMQHMIFFMEVKDGKLAVEKTPVGAMTAGYDAPRARDYFKGVRDATGALWFLGAKYPLKADPPFPEVDLAVRVTAGGVDIPYEGAGWPWLADRGGNLWLAHERGQKDPMSSSESTWELNICRDGKVACTLSVPGLRWDGRTFLVSDRAGSVWAWTATGLYHLTADDPAAPAKFAIKSSYFVRGMEGKVANVTLSPLGFLAIRTFVVPEKQGGAYYALSIVPLPKD